MALSMETGERSRTATNAHRAQWSAFGAFFSTSRAAATASTSQLAAMLVFRISVKDMAHTSFSYSSSIFRISSRSERLRPPRRVKAAMKAGRLPPQVSSRNFRL